MLPRWLFLALLIVALAAGSAATQDAAAEEIVANAMAKEAAVLAAELGQLRAKISALESRIAEQTLELKTKDDANETLKKVIEQESQKIATLQSEITSVKAKGSSAAEEQASKANAQAIELEKQIDKLKKDIKAPNSKRAALEARAGDAEKKVQELNGKLEKLQRTSNEQKRRIQKTELALRAAEEELMKVQLETTTKLKQPREELVDPDGGGFAYHEQLSIILFTATCCEPYPVSLFFFEIIVIGVVLIVILWQVHGAWLPPWLATHAAHSMEVMANHWNEHGKPVVNSLLQKASEKSAEPKKWAKPHLETAKGHFP